MHDPTITPESLIVTRGLRTTAILAALFNAAAKIGHGEGNPGPETITEADAKVILASQGHRSFDYLFSKRLKLDLNEAEKDGIIAGQYDFYYGRGTAKRAIEILKTTGNPCHPDIIALQAISKVAAMVRIGCRPKSGTITEGNLAEALGLTEPISLSETEWEKLHRGHRPGSDNCREAHSAEDLEENRRSEFKKMQGIPCITINL